MAFNDKGKSRRNTGREETQGELMKAAALILTDRQTSDCHWAMREEAHLSELKPLREMQAQVQEANMHQWTEGKESRTLLSVQRQRTYGIRLPKE
jgi:hypothetical protein